MQKALTLLLTLLFLSSSVFATTTQPLDVVLDADGKIQIDRENPRSITGCWDSDEQAVMFYRDEERNIIASEICNEPDEKHHGLGITDAARALNYYDFLNVTREEISAVKAPIVLGSLSGYNYSWLKKFLQLENACDKFDILAFHPYHLGVAPDEIDTSKNAWHTVEQWVNFYREILKAAGCEKPIWVTEFGFSTSDFEAEKAVSETEQADFALKQLVMLLGEGVERVSYFNKLSFALSDEGAETWNDLAGKLEGSKFESFKMSGENYCPVETSCFQDEDEYRADTGESIFGLPAAANEMQKNRTYSFEKDDGKRVFVFWETGKPGVGVLESPFSDVSIDTAHANAILEIAARGIISGYSDGSFKPDLQINRAELLKILVEATKDAGIQISGSNCFPDVGNEWFAPFVCYGKARGWVAGYPDGNFLPANPVNRAEALKIVANAFNWNIAETTEGEWYLPFANAALSEGALLPAEAKDYGNAQNRGFIAELVWRAIK
ncbi:S-layer homology domain-containing protein [Patescibacteria group bacterium]|nr:S-layer homology domain-containing protein [Patescibacteria group bacterium]